MKSQEIYSVETAAGWLPWGILAPVLGLMFLIASELASDPLLKRLVRLDANGLPVDMAGLAVFLLIPSGLLLMIVLLWIRLVERRSLAAIGLTGTDKFRRFLRAHVVGMLSILGIVGAIWLAGGLGRASAEASSFLGSAWTSPGALLSIVVLFACFALQASTEEVFFRGWLLSLLAKKFNPLLAVVVSSALFALVHLSRGQHWLITLSNALFGVFCCVWVLRSRSLLGVMGWHAGWNWLLAVGFGLPVTGIDVGIPALLVALKPVGADWLSGGAEGPEGSVVCVAYFIGAILALCLSKKANQSPRTDNAQAGGLD